MEHIIANSFRHHANFEVLKKFDRPMNKYTFILFRVFIYLHKLLNLHKVFKIFFGGNKVVFKRNTDITSITFTENQNKVLKTVLDMGVNCDIISFNIKPKAFSASFLSDMGLLKMALCNKSLGGIIPLVKADIVLKNNLLRVVKLYGLMTIEKDLFSGNDIFLNLNDHSPYNVFLHDMAKYRNKKTIYIQHAPVSDKFPPLYHDLNILFSKDSRKKYKNPFKKEVFLLYDLRMLESKIVKENPINSILICTNLLDDIFKVRTLIIRLQELGYKIRIRPHPRDKRNWEIDKDVMIDNKNVWDSFNNCSIVIANESAILLEAIVANKLIYKAGFFSESLDNYGFIEAGLILKEYNDQEEMVKHIIDGKINYNKSKINYFVGELDSKKLAKDLIIQIDKLKSECISH